MPSRPFFSVVIACTDSPRATTKLVQGVLAQGWDDFELVIAGAPRTVDETLAPLAQDDRVVSLKDEAYRHPSGARNAGITTARGWYLWLPSAEDEFDSSVLARFALSTLSVPGGPDVLLAGHKERFVSSNGSELFVTNETSLHGAIVADLGAAFATGATELLGGLCVKAELVRKANLNFADNALTSSALFTTRVFAQNPTVALAQGAPLVRVRYGGRALTEECGVSARDYWNAWERVLTQQYGLLTKTGRLSELGPALGARYVFHLVRAVYLTFLDVDAGIEHWTDRRKAEWMRMYFETETYRELVERANAQGDALLAAGIQAARMRWPLGLMGIAHAVYAAEKYGLSGFERMRFEE